MRRPGPANGDDIEDPGILDEELPDRLDVQLLVLRPVVARPPEQPRPAELGDVVVGEEERHPDDPIHPHEVGGPLRVAEGSPLGLRDLVLSPNGGVERRHAGDEQVLSVARGRELVLLSGPEGLDGRRVLAGGGEGLLAVLRLDRHRDGNRNGEQARHHEPRELGLLAARLHLNLHGVRVCFTVGAHPTAESIDSGCVVLPVDSVKLKNDFKSGRAYRLKYRVPPLAELLKSQHISRERIRLLK